MIERIELVLVRFKLDFVKESVESLELHGVDVLLLLYSLGHDGLICKADSPAPLRSGELIVVYDVEDPWSRHRHLLLLMTSMLQVLAVQSHDLRLSGHQLLTGLVAVLKVRDRLLLRYIAQFLGIWRLRVALVVLSL